MCTPTCCGPLNTAFEFVQTSASEVSQTFATYANKVERARKQFVAASYDHCPAPMAIIIERISTAIPETFVALASLVGGVVALPALLVSWGRKIFPMLPLVKAVLQGNLSEAELGNGCKKMLEGFGELYERTLIPALFVALAIDTIFSFTLGWIFWDFERMLHATAIALPGACLAAQHMLSNADRGYSLRA